MEQWPLRNLTGTSCGVGDQEKLDQVWAINPVTKRLDADGDSWSREESARDIEAGYWDVVIDYDSGTGGGPPNKIRALVTVQDGSCAVKQTILNEEVVVSKGKTGGRVIVPGVNLGQLSLEEDDKIVLELSKTSGRQNVDVRYNGHSNSNSSSRLRNPDTAFPAGQLDVSHLEVEIPDPA